jgi:hypothetical protein
MPGNERGARPSDACLTKEKQEEQRRRSKGRKEELTLGDHLLDVVPVVGEENDDLRVGLDEVDGLGVRPHGLHQADGVRVDLLRFLGHVRDLVGDVVVQPDQVPHLLKERDHLRIKVDDELVLVRHPRSNDVKKPTRDLHVPPLDVVQPGLVERSSVELLDERGRFGLELLAFRVLSPSLAEDVFDSLHIRRELTFDLTSPDDGAGNGREISHGRHVESVRVTVSRGEGLVEAFDVVLDGLE